MEDMNKNGVNYGEDIIPVDQLLAEAKSFKPTFIHHRKKGLQYKKRSQADLIKHEAKQRIKEEQK